MFEFLRKNKRRSRVSRYDKQHFEALEAQAMAYKEALKADRTAIAHYKRALEVQETLSDSGYDIGMPEPQPTNLVEGLSQIIKGSDLNQGIKTGAVSMINSNPNEINMILNQFIQSQMEKIQPGKEKDILNV